MSKQINVIVYRPGLGGMFLTYLMSIHNSTMMPGRDWKHADRTQQWTYRDLHKIHGSWLAHHRSLAFDLRGTVNRYMQNLGTKSLTVSTHPYNFYHKDANDIRVSGADIRYLHVCLSTQHEWRLEAFFAKNPWPKDTELTWHDERQRDYEAMYIEQYRPYQIDFSLIMDSESQFLDQYHKLNSHLGLPNIDDQALREYRFWREARGLTEMAGEVGIEPTTR